LGKLKAKDAVAVLLEDIEYPGVIDALGEIGDPRALPALREMVAAGGRIVRNGNPASPERNGKRLFAAKVALTQFDLDDGALRLAEMLDDPTWERNQRYEIVLRLIKRPDARVIPHLVNVIKQEPDYYIVDLAIQALAQMKYRAAVEGLIECFDADFKAHDLAKRERVTPASQRNHIARSLQSITGQSFGGDKHPWLKWWQETGKQSREFK
jgi:HEAT repeat protein